MKRTSLVKNAAIMRFLVGLIVLGSTAVIANDLESEIVALRSADSSTKINVTRIVSSHILIGVNKHEALNYLVSKKFRLHFEKPVDDREHVVASKEIRKWYRLGFDEIRIVIEFNQDKAENVEGWLFYHSS